MLGREAARASVLLSVITLFDLQQHAVTRTPCNTERVHFLITSLQTSLFVCAGLIFEGFPFNAGRPSFKEPVCLHVCVREKQKPCDFP